MIANDARTIVYESMEKHGIIIDDTIVQSVNAAIVEAAENLSFACTAELFSCNSPVATKECRRDIICFYHSLGYNCYIQPRDGMYEIVLKW